MSLFLNKTLKTLNFKGNDSTFVEEYFDPTNSQTRLTFNPPSLILYAKSPPEILKRKFLYDA